MATALDTYLFYDSGNGANVAEAGWRQSMRHMLGSASGVIRGFLNEFSVFGDSSGMQVKADTGECWIRGQYGQSTAVKTLPIAAAHATLARKDRVILRNDFVNNRIELDVLTGTPAASPAAPSVSQTTAVWETSLAYVSVPATDTSIDSGQVTDDRVYTSAHARFRNSVLQAVSNNTVTKAAFDTTVSRSGDIVFNTSTNDFTLLRSGLWVLKTNFLWVSNGTGARYLWISRVGSENSDRLGQQVLPPTSALGCGLNCSADDRFAAGETVAAYVFQSSGGSLNSDTTAKSCNFSAMWVGP